MIFKECSESIEEFLIENCTKNDYTSSLKSIKSKSKELQSSLEDVIRWKNHLKLSLDKQKSALNNLSIEQNVPVLLTKLDEYTFKELKIQLLEVSLLLDKLATCTNIHQIPDLVISIKHSAPHVIPNHSKIKSKLVETTNNIKKQQISIFHDRFEIHLNTETDRPLSHTTTNNYQNQGNIHVDQSSIQSWISFLQESKHWLIAYVCLSMLPTLLTESSHRVQEKFLEALDESLLPLWGRFHFHLISARETAFAYIYIDQKAVPTSKNGNNSSSSSEIVNNQVFSTQQINTNRNILHSISTPFLEQLLWSFSYASHFMDMILQMIQELTSSTSKLHILYSFQYYEVAYSHILDKICKFMRAHFADIIVRYSHYFFNTTDDHVHVDDLYSQRINSSSNKEDIVSECIMALVEHIFHFDAIITQKYEEFYQSNITSYNSNSGSNSIKGVQRSPSTVLNTTSSTHTSTISLSTTNTTTTTRSSAKSRMAHRLTVSQVLSESKLFYTYWLRFEHTHITKRLYSILDNIENVYKIEFGSLAPTRYNIYGDCTTTPLPGKDKVITLPKLSHYDLDDDYEELEEHSYHSDVYYSSASVASSSSTSCYSGIYELMKLFILLTQRYQYLSKTSQDQLSALILEPLLSLIVGLFLYKIKLDPFIYAVSHTSSTYLEELLTPSLLIQYQESKYIPICIQEYLASVTYFQSCLNNSCYKSLSLQSVTRYEDVSWKNIYTWIPQRMIYKSELLINTQLTLSRMIFDNFETVDWTSILSSDKSKFKNISTTTTTNNNNNTTSNNTCEYYIDIARAQVLTISEVLQKQYHKHMIAIIHNTKK